MRLFDFIDAVAGLEVLDHEAVGALFRQTFALRSANDHFNRYALDRLVIDDVLDATAIDLREPRPGGKATGGALLTMRIGGDCVALATIKARYPQAKLFAVPRGRSAEEKTVHQVVSGNRAVRFGFRETEPKCLSDLTFETIV